MERKYKSYIQYYRIVWGIVVLILLLLKYINLQNNAKINLSSAFIIYALSTWIPIMIIYIFEGCRADTYMCKYHYNYWKTFTEGTPIFGYKSKDFLHSKDNLNDPIVEEIKLNLRKFIIFTVTVFISYPLICILFFFI